MYENLKDFKNDYVFQEIKIKHSINIIDDFWNDYFSRKNVNERK